MMVSEVMARRGMCVEEEEDGAAWSMERDDNGC